MAIYKAPASKNFTQIPNATLQDTSLSFEAKGLLVLILSLPEDWEIHKTWLQKQTPKCGQDKLKRILKELNDTGYMVKKVKQSENGKLAGWDWFVYPEKQPQPIHSKASTVGVKNRPTVSPTVGEPVTTNKHINKQTKTTTTGEAKSKISLSEFSGLVKDQMQGSGVPEWFVLNYAHDLHGQYKNPRVAMAVKIIWQDWNNSERKTVSSIEVPTQEAH